MIRNFLLVSALIASPAIAQESADRTASWFAAHPREMHNQIASCLDDPGHGQYVPNCANASQGRALRQAADDERQFNASVARMNAEQIQQWRANPQALLARLTACNHATQALQRQVWNCDAAFAVAQAITGHR